MSKPITKTRLGVAVSLLAVLALLGTSEAYRLAAALSEPAIVRTAAATMATADPAKIAEMECLFEKTKAMPESAYATLPDETTPTESKLTHVLAYLQNVRPTDGGDGPTGALRMGRLIKEAASQYRGFLSRRLGGFASGGSHRPADRQPGSHHDVPAEIATIAIQRIGTNAARQARHLRV